MVNDLIAGKTAKARTGRGGVTTGGKGAANRTMAVLGAMLEFARRQKIINENVARDVRKPAAGKQDRFLSEDEMRQLGAAMREVAEVENPVALMAIRFALLTGCRKIEILSLPWQWVDEKGGCIRFGDTKTGAQIRPIGKSAFEALNGLPQASGWVFPASRGSGHFFGMRKALDRFCKRAGLEGVTIHVLRHSFASMAAAMGFTQLTIAGLLGHSVGGVTARYAHVADKVLVDAANKISAKIAALLDGK